MDKILPFWNKICNSVTIGDILIIFIKMKRNPIYILLIGDKDEIIQEVNIEKQEKLLQQNNVDYDLIRYKGTHKIDVHILKELAGKL